jgi:hypothetical protein
MTEKRVYTEEILEEINTFLPTTQPYPLHIHKIIAKKLGYSNKYVNLAIWRLIKKNKAKVLEEYTVVELRQIAKDRNIKSFSQLRKLDLIALIRKETK